MNFHYWDLGMQQGGTIVEVILSGNAANVRLLDSSNFSSYKAGQRHTYFGGHATSSPVRLTIPNAGHWYVAIDFGGTAGSARASVRVLPGALPPLRQQSFPSLAQIGANVDTDRPAGERGPITREWDVFISHATEDKESVVRPLAHALQSKGLQVWYDEFELRLGDSLRRKIDNGLAKSRFGVVVLSPAFFAKNWSQYELDGLVTREMSGQQVILPLWHHISKDEILAVSPSLADKVARRTADLTIDEIAEEIAQRIHQP